MFANATDGVFRKQAFLQFWGLGIPEWRQWKTWSVVRANFPVWIFLFTYVLTGQKIASIMVLGTGSLIS